MPKKILFIITKSNWGGAQRYVYDVATRLSPTDFSVSVLFGGNGTLADKLREKNIRTLSLEKMWRDINIIEDIKSFFSLISILRKESPDIVHLNSTKIGGLGALAARIAGVPKIIFTVHGWAFNEQRPVWQKMIIKFISWLTVFLCTDVIFISKTEFVPAQTWPLVAHKTKLIYNGIESPAFHSQEMARTELAKVVSIDPEIFQSKKLALTIAELTANKGLIYALDAIRDIPDIAYILIGGGEQETQIREYIEKHNLINRVFLAGFVKDAARFLKAADYFLLPSVKEGLSYVLIEAGFAALPTIATDVGGTSEIIEHEFTGLLIPSQSAQAIENALLSFYDQPEKAQTLGTSLYTKVNAQFTITEMVKNTISVYSNRF